MPISSYLAYPRPGKGRDLAVQLADLPGCDVAPSDDYSLLIVVTDTPGEAAEADLQRTLRAIPELGGLALVFCHGEAKPRVENES